MEEHSFSVQNILIFLSFLFSTLIQFPISTAVMLSSPKTTEEENMFDIKREFNNVLSFFVPSVKITIFSCVFSFILIFLLFYFPFPFPIFYQICFI